MSGLSAVHEYRLLHAIGNELSTSIEICISISSLGWYNDEEAFIIDMANSLMSRPSVERRESMVHIIHALRNASWL